MKSRERVKKAFHFDKPDRVPILCISLQSDFFAAIQLEPRTFQPKNLPPHIMGGDTTIANPGFRWVAYSWKKKFRKQAGYPKKWWKYPGTRIDEWGVIWQASGIKFGDKTLGHPIHGPLEENWDSLDDFTIPDASDENRYRIMKTGLWRLLGRNRYSIGTMGVDGIFHRTCHFRGFTNLLMDLARNPKKVEQLVNKILPFYLIQAEKIKENFPICDCIMVADDLGTQKSPFLSPRMFKKYYAPAYKKLIDLTHDLGMDFILHSCGEIYDLLQPLIDIGVDVFEFDSPFMTGIDKFKHFAEERKAAFWLSSNIQTTYLSGTPKEVEEEVKYHIKEIGSNEGGVAIYEYPQNYSLGTPKLNIKAQRKAVKKWGNYSPEGVLEWLA